MNWKASVHSLTSAPSHFLSTLLPLPPTSRLLSSQGHFSCSLDEDMARKKNTKGHHPEVSVELHAITDLIRLLTFERQKTHKHTIKSRTLLTLDKPLATRCFSSPPLPSPRVIASTFKEGSGGNSLALTASASGSSLRGGDASTKQSGA